jgi:hypothetical protein
MTRTEVLENLISTLRHEIRGAIASTSLIADAMLANSDPAVRRSGQRIATTIFRITTTLNATLEIVPPRSLKIPLKKNPASEVEFMKRLDATGLMLEC